LSADSIDMPLAEYRGRSLFHWTVFMRLTSPTDQLFAHREFFRRFCFDDRVTDAGGGLLQIHFAQPGRKKNEVDVLGTMTFRKGVPGPSRVDWEYVRRGQTIGKAQMTFDDTRIDGTTFPLALRNTVQRIDPRTHAVISEGYIETKYTAFARVDH
jgi:hypothetical protein